MTFRSKIDLWLAAVLTVAAAASLIATFASASHATGLGLLGPTVLAAMGAGLPLWLLFSTSYLVERERLLIRSGPFTWQVPVLEITRITPTRSPISSPALSLDRLRIEYGAGKTVLISPRDQQEFIRAISAAKSAAQPINPSDAAR